MRVSGGRQSRQFQENLRAWPEGDRSSRATGSPPVRLIVATVSSFVLADASVSIGVELCPSIGVQD
jgi:hypothetical protein